MENGLRQQADGLCNRKPCKAETITLWHVQKCLNRNNRMVGSIVFFWCTHIIPQNLADKKMKRLLSLFLSIYLFIYLNLVSLVLLALSLSPPIFESVYKTNCMHNIFSWCSIVAIKMQEHSGKLVSRNRKERKKIWNESERKWKWKWKWKQ